MGKKRISKKPNARKSAAADQTGRQPGGTSAAADGPVYDARHKSPPAGGGPGRPRGSATTAATARGELTRCHACGSTDREPYLSRREQAIAGVDPAGRPYTHVVWRRCRCARCGQYRIDRHTENRV